MEMNNNIKWGIFEIGKLFNNFEQGKCKNASILKPGDIPYIGATNKNNGTMNFVKYDREIISKGNCIIFISQGDGSAGYSIYKKEDCICGSTVILAYSPFINLYTGLFISCCSDMNQSKYSHGYSRNMDRLKKDHIMLPTNENNEPNYQYMENFIKDLLKNKRNSFKSYAMNKIEKIKENNKIICNMNYSPTKISDIFESIQRGKRLKNENHVKGCIPYISSSALDNGVSDYVSNDNGRMFEHCITLANSGSVGSSFYQSYKFVASDHVTHLKGKKLNEFSYLFLCTMLNRLSGKYNFNREINDIRIKCEKILVPVSCGNIDYIGMEESTKKIYSDKLNKYLEYCKEIKF